MEAESARLTFWSSTTSSRFYDDWGESIVEIATNTPFPESGIVPTVVVYGFLGLVATAQGLEIAPQLPRGLVELTVGDVSFAGHGLTISATRGDIVAAQGGNDTYEQVGSAPVVSAPITPPAPFNEVSLLARSTYRESVKDPGESEVEMTIALDRQTAHGWETIQARQADRIVDGDWLPLAVPAQPGGSVYRLRALSSTAGAGWYADGSGALALRAVNARQSGAEWRSEAPSDFTAASSFDRITLRGVTSPSVLRLERRVGDEWRTVHQQTVIAAGDGLAVLAFADQPPGFYRVDTGGGSVSVQGIERGVYRLAMPEASVTTDVAAGDTYLWAPPSAHGR